MISRELSRTTSKHSRTHTTHHLIELPGADLGAKLVGAERFLACSIPASTHMAREAMPDGYRPGLAS